MITVAAYRNLIDADLAKNRLNGDGIEAFIADEANATAGYGAMTGWIRLQVSESDAARASEILAKATAAGLPDDIDPGKESEMGTGEEDKEPESGRSVSEELRRLSRTVQNGTIVIIIALLLSCLYLSVKFGPAQRMERERKTPSWSQVNSAMDRCDYNKAIERVQALLAKHPGDPYGHSYLTSLYVSVGDLADARKEAQAAYDLFPTEDHRQRILAVEKLQQQAATNAITSASLRGNGK